GPAASPPRPDRADGAGEPGGPRHRHAGVDDRGAGRQRPPVHPPERRRGRRPGGCRAGDGALAPRVTAAHGLLPGWFVLTLLAALGANGLANSMTRVTIELMRSPSPFAQQVRDFHLLLLPAFQVDAGVLP